MSAILIPLAAILLLYAPGRAWLSRAIHAQNPEGSRLLFEVLLSASLTSWIAFILAETGQYSIWLLSALQLANTALGTWVNRRARPRPYDHADASILAIFVLSAFWIGAPLDTRLLSGDSTGYLASGLHLSRSGSLVIHDQSVGRLSLDDRRILFPSVAKDYGSPPYLRLQGSFVLRTLDSDEVLPAFHHLLTVWTAIGGDLAGRKGGEWIMPLFFALAVCAVFTFAVTIGRPLMGWILIPLFLLAPPEWWYGRFLMPEVPAQFFLWGGLAGLIPAVRGQSESTPGACAAGLALGVAGLMRIENAVFVSAALLSLVWLKRNISPALRIAGVAAFAVWLHLALHSFCFRTHYWGILTTFLSESASQILGIAVLAGVTLAAVLWKMELSEAWRRRALHLILITAVVAAFGGDLLGGGRNLGLLDAYLGTPLLLLGACSLGWLAIKASNPGEELLLAITAIVAAQVLIAPHATPVPIWAIRRAVPVLIPGICISGAFLLARQWAWWRSLALVVLLITVIWSLALGRPFYDEISILGRATMSKCCGACSQRTVSS